MGFLLAAQVGELTFIGLTLDPEKSELAARFHESCGMLRREWEIVGRIVA